MANANLAVAKDDDYYAQGHGLAAWSPSPRSARPYCTV